MNVLIIPEDFRQDQFVLKPIIKAMLSALGKRRATVKVCRDPLLPPRTEGEGGWGGEGWSWLAVTFLSFTSMPLSPLPARC